ncbi:zinc-dependent alcohol dehydrogenase family protein [Brevibacillus choshinensis]|uniref:zinc-dependent alcohol dehydrogenase family protein n=1 Tax=Brevibacillus choshinensis TaxID=54911 RepID=UPI0009FB7B23|nr:zinc-dependent alcohol dehydrogenase family protein [Brevibacillus choshinensis]
MLNATCVKYNEFGIPQDVLRVESARKEPPGNGELLVRMIVNPINPSDLIPITGAYAHRIALPDIPGYEGVGIVEEVGPSVSRELIGKRVLPLRGEGTWQEIVKARADLVIPVPDHIGDYKAAQLYINPVTAWITCTEVLRLRPDDILLINAGGSAIGRIFAQLAKIVGYRLIAITRDDWHSQQLLELGASYVIHGSEKQLHETVMELTYGMGAHAAIDSVGGVAGTELAFSVRPGGHFLTIGLLSGQPVDWAKIHKEAQVNVKLFHLRHWNQQISVQAWQETFRHLISMVVDGKLRLIEPKACYSLREVHEAVRVAASSGGRDGKVFLVNSNY